MQPKLRWGLMGASDIAETRMLPALRRCGHRVTAVLSASTDRARDYAARNDIRHAFADMAAFTSCDEIDAVYVSSVNDLHLAQVRAAAEAGKHVLCEKPVATTLADAEAIIACCRTGGIVLAVNHHLPAAGTHRAMRELVARGAIGRPLAVGVQHATLLPERLRGWRLSGVMGAGAVFDLSCHDASVINPLLGTRAIETTAITAAQGPWAARSEDVSMAVIRYEGDVLAQLHDSFTSPYTPTVFEVHGDAGSIRAVDVMTPEPIGTVMLTDQSGTQEIEVDDRRHTYDITLEAFSRAVVGDGRPVVTGEDAYHALAISLSILESAATRQRVAVRFWNNA
jgi:1,5-anhydro-D-fructose reductase (1,5-anhydro-D-mannitol-forming)